MKKHLTIALTLLFIAVSIYGGENEMKINIIVGDAHYTATLNDNDAAAAFYSMLPLTLDMEELNGNEKYYYLDSRLSADASRPRGGIHAGDLMLYGSSCVVLFYKSFQTSYTYTPLGKLDSPDGIERAVGRGDVQVVFTKAE